MNLPEDGGLELGSSTTYTYAQLLDLVEQHGEVIITTQYFLIEKLKNALATRKSRANKNLKDKGIPVDDSRLEYSTLGEADKDGWIRLKINLKQSSAIPIKNISIPGEF